MEDPQKKEKEIEEVVQEDVNHYKLTISHRKCKGIEKTVREISSKIADIKKDTQGKNFKASGPGRMPTKHLSICTRKSPCGNGTNTFDHFELNIHKRVFHIFTTQRNFQNVISGIHTEPGMILEADLIESD